MIKMHAKRDGKTIVLLGLEEMNVIRMREGKPMKIDGAEIGLPGATIMIILGRDTTHLREMVEPLIGPETVIDNKDFRLKQ